MVRSFSFQLFRGLAFAAAFASLATGCTGSSDDLHADDTDFGGMRIALQLAPSVSLNTLSYVLSGHGFTKSGFIDVSGSTTVSARIDGIPAGNGFNLAVSGSLAGDGGTCSASSVFNVARGQTTTVTLALRCRTTPQKGSVQIHGQVNVCPRIDAVDVSPMETQVGKTITLNGLAVDPDGAPAPLTTTWSSGIGAIDLPQSAKAALVCKTVGPGAVTFTVGDGDCTDMVTVAIACTATLPDQPMPSVHINEVESNGGTPGDWIELVNTGTGVADLSGWVLKDNDDTHRFTLPAGTMLAAGAFAVFGEPEMTFGLGSGDSVRLYDPSGVLVASHTWTGHATTTYGRCPDGQGTFVTTTVSTKGAANACPTAIPADAGVPSDAPAMDTSITLDAAPIVEAGPAPIVVETWPGDHTVTEVDDLNQFGDNLSGLTYEPATGVLWAALNSPSLIYRLVRLGSVWVFDSTNGWGAGKAIHYLSGTGNPDTESLTKAEWDQPSIYVATERNNDASSISRLAILRFDTSASGPSLTASHEWDLTADLPVTGANLGLEAITWVPDTYLVANGFIDDKTGAAYFPSNYPNHGTGLFLVGIEGTGMIHAYALNHATNGFDRLASFSSGRPAVMGMEFDRETGALWAYCDNTCGNVVGILGVTSGAFLLKRSFARPSTLPDSNHEGIALAPESECVAGKKPIFWSDDSHYAGHALRTGTIPCGPLF